MLKVVNIVILNPQTKEVILNHQEIFNSVEEAEQFVQLSQYSFEKDYDTNIYSYDIKDPDCSDECCN
jgi:hypothetical protein